MLREAMGLQLNPDRVSFSVSNDGTAAEAAKATSRAATPTKMDAAHGMPNRRVTALQFLFFMFLCMYTTILDLGYVNFLARDTTGDCAWRSISGVDATISLQFIGNAVNSREAKMQCIFPEPSSALITCSRDPCSATSLEQKEFTDIGGDGHFSREVSVASLTALARRSLNIEILRDPAKGK